MNCHERWCNEWRASWWHESWQRGLSVGQRGSIRDAGPSHLGYSQFRHFGSRPISVTTSSGSALCAVSSTHLKQTGPTCMTIQIIRLNGTPKLNWWRVQRNFSQFSTFVFPVKLCTRLLVDHTLKINDFKICHKVLLNFNIIINRVTMIIYVV